MEEGHKDQLVVVQSMKIGHSWGEVFHTGVEDTPFPRSLANRPPAWMVPAQAGAGAEQVYDSDFVRKDASWVEFATLADSHFSSRCILDASVVSKRKRKHSRWALSRPKIRLMRRRRWW